jgi:archaellum component FlaC
MNTDETKIIEMDLKSLLESLTNVHKSATAGLSAELESLEQETNAVQKNIEAASQELGEILDEAERDIEKLIIEEKADRNEDEEAASQLV